MAKSQKPIPIEATVVPTGDLLKLKPADIRPNFNNPRLLFDPEPLRDLKENIRVHGVLVPITVYQLPASRKYGILDGARRHQCCVELEEEGTPVEIPANVVRPPDKLAGLLYMFSIHNFREPWELMPTALSLKIVIDELGETDSKKLSHVTGLSEPQVERCKKLPEVPDHLKQLSLDANPKTRIPSNLWIEAHPLLEIVSRELPDVWKSLGNTGLLEKLVEKYQAKRIKSVIHFRRIVEAFEIYESDPENKARFIAQSCG
jgi:ParB family transcriptional regulator, chromosome partitioning protein